MASETSFPEKVLDAFKKIINEIEKGSVEHDIRPRFVKYFVEPVLGYSGSNYRYEKKRTDITIFDENDFAIIKIETKKPEESIEKPQHEEQAFKYEEETTKFIGLTNFLQFKLWEIKKTGNELKINLDFSRILEQKKTIEQLSSEEKTHILFFNNLTKDTLFDKSKYEKFDENYARIDITKEAGFNKLLDRLNYIANTLLYGYTLKSFGEYKEGYGKYQAELNKAEQESKNNRKNHELNHNIAKYKQKLEEKYEKYKTFAGYELWKEYSGKADVPDNEIKEIFCKETIYVFLNKLLFLRICEDKGLLEKNISNGGIEELRKFLRKRFKEDTVNKEILEIAFKSARGLYSHFYETGILDWFRTGDGEFNELLNRVLWIFNQFNFAHIDRDILGNLYEKYLPGKERKRLGEFYTPTEVIDYILTAVGYTYNKEIETKDLLDPACGSGGFLVRATRRLMSRYLVKFGKTDKKELENPKNWQEIINRLSPDEAKMILESIQERIIGLDINPFACHIAEMNLLFQTVDLYQKAREKNPDYKFNRFKIFRTDSLEKPTQKHLWDYSYAAFLEEQEETDKIKQKKFDYVVGNPPYVRVQSLDEKTKDYLSKTYSSAIGIFDLYVVFIERGFNWLKNKGKFGYIISNKFMQSSYGAGIREFIVKNCTIDRLIDFGDSGVFKDVTNYPLIFIGTNQISTDSRFIFIKVLESTNQNELMDEIWKNSKEDYYKSEHLEIFEIEQKTLNEKPWTLSNPAVMRLLRKIEKNSKNYFINNFARPHRCLYTGLNEAYLVDSKVIKEERLENELIKKVIGGKDIRRWNIIWKNELIIYPYKKIDGKLTPVFIDNYPNTKRHLEQFKDKLIERWFVKKIKKEERDKRWFEYADPRDTEQFERPKIITPDISTNNRFVLDFDELYSLNTSYVIDLDKFTQNPKYLLGLLNSSTLDFYFKQISPFISGGYHRYINQYLEKLPIKLPETSEEKKIVEKIVKKVDEILELSKSSTINLSEILKDKETEKLGKLPKVTFSIRDDTVFEKIETKGSKLYINDIDFIEITDKKIMDFVRVYLNFYKDDFSKTKDVKGMIINLPIPKSDGVLKDIIKKGDIEHSQTKDKIKVLEQEINELVYEIYGIKKERKIIENNLSS